MTRTVGGVHHLAVVSADLDRSERFYVGVLGLTVLRRWPHPNGGLRSVWVGLGNGAFLAIERAEREAPRRDDEAPGWHCVALGIAAADRAWWREHLRQEGHPVERETDHTLYVRDPDGQLLGLSHWPEAVG